MSKANILYAQSGGATAVINATAGGLIETARSYPDKIDKIYAAHNGILGVLNEELIDTNCESDESIAALQHTPASAFGTCRYKLKGIKEDKAQYQRLLEVFKAHNIQYFFYNGGGDSQDTSLKISQLSQSSDYPLTCIGIPKTIDNDLPLTDCCPGFGSVAKYIAVSVKEAALDVACMASTSTKVFILEVMGRHAGWIAAASGLARCSNRDAPHLILFPEVPWDEAKVLDKVDWQVKTRGYCVIVASEGLKDQSGKFLSESGAYDAFGHVQLGGVAPLIAKIIKDKLGYKYHWAVSDYLQRSARHIASHTDVEQAYTLGQRAIELALDGQNAVMLTIVRLSDRPYKWKIGTVDLSKVANREHTLPKAYISKNGLNITAACENYMRPLIEGEDYPPYEKGLPNYVKMKKILADKRLEKFEST